MVQTQSRIIPPGDASHAARSRKNAEAATIGGHRTSRAEGRCPKDGQNCREDRARQRSIEADIEKYGGVYPYEGGRLSAEEVWRRAGLSRSLLQKPRHQDLRDEVNKWLKEIKKKQIKGKKVVRKAVTERADSAEDELTLIRQRWVEAELEFVEQANEIARLTRKCAELEEEIKVLKIEASRNKAAQLDPNDLAEFVRDLLSNAKALPVPPPPDPS